MNNTKITDKFYSLIIDYVFTFVSTNAKYVPSIKS